MFLLALPWIVGWFSGSLGAHMQSCLTESVSVNMNRPDQIDGQDHNSINPNGYATTHRRKAFQAPEALSSN
jgi:hypothetical protein